ncbi:NAD(P)/FAD-dependent oxidoreductase [Pseudomonas sp. LB3P38]|uniref:NAD(P)/FAD-dependent oxidoreductase n=1 Tax=Pseudomonas lyxosi TaxID=3398358 RepID=UPI0039F14408
MVDSTQRRRLFSRASAALHGISLRAVVQSRPRGPNVTRTSGCDALVVGAGVVGIATALQLQLAGLEVLLLDQNPPASGTSSGNAGAIAISEVLPLADAKTLRKIPGWLFDPMGPLAVRWRHLPTLAPWLSRYLLASRAGSVSKLTQQLAYLLGRTLSDLQPLVVRSGLDGMWRRQGALMVYATQKELRADLEGWKLRGKHGVNWQLCNPEQVYSLEPALSAQWRNAVSITDFSHVEDPYLFTLGLFQQFIAEGGRFEQHPVAALRQQGGKVTGVMLRDGQTIDSSRVIVASGVWSDHFSKPISQNLPLESERGYHLTLPHAQSPLKRYVMNHSESFVVLPMGNGALRLAGTVELASRYAAPDYRRARMLLSKAESMLGTLNTEGMTEWMGNRPSVPETVPVIGPSAKVDQLYFATGHGHLGLTLSATTGAMLRDHIVGKQPIPEEYRPSRY